MDGSAFAGERGGISKTQYRGPFHMRAAVSQAVIRSEV